MWIELGDGGAIEYLYPCAVRLNRCCGEGPLFCAKERDHAGPHEDEGVIW